MTLINLIGFQLVWFASIGGAGLGLWWPGVLAFALFGAWELSHSPAPRSDLVLLAKACALGFVVDGAFAFSGALAYAAPVPSADFAPVWILALWAAFALTLRRSLRWLMERPRVAAALGAVFGPMSYWAAAAAWSAVEFRMEPAWALALLAVAWAIATPLCLRWARQGESQAPARSQRRHAGADKAENF